MKTKLHAVAMLAVCIFAFAPHSNAQTTVTVDGSAAWIGYANIFDNGAYQFGNGWALADLKSVVDPISVTLYPNFNTYNASDPYWSNGELGNKTFEGNTFVENAALAGQTLTFTATVESNSFASGYTVIAFIKGLNPANGYSTDVLVTTPLVAGQTFSITAPNIPAGLLVQYGFSVTGLNGNPAHADELGNARVIPAALAVSQFSNENFEIFPNPASDNITIQAAKNIENIAVYNILGQEIMSRNPSASLVNVNISNLQNGIYIVKSTIAGKTKTTRIVKN
ncbi:hypothetical protein FNO01nite_19060 [Flavobacterium noncentrifugens]|uniref:Por secretion system C-terminal sorting domain-containing protein n=1 Tax=Flavobacterium noncentrifugens TaxID=1128970 RepID=A0A1G8YJV9_9FLAO|nr:T9SS type A sorting domain-containing protein [Flavobacterium noncentrifugens]GEP51234.1 hypothetical protein FNO01nite_19060 [Flavobacterium noncentrifugens]SDK02465.1 Por secretion system C-terminal sorting domain-containing protein [Flavobacterium noncentrifugens]